MKIADIRPYEKNPRLNEGAVDAVADSLRNEFGNDFRINHSVLNKSGCHGISAFP